MISTLSGSRTASRGSTSPARPACRGRTQGYRTQRQVQGRSSFGTMPAEALVFLIFRARETIYKITMSADYHIKLNMNKPARDILSGTSSDSHALIDLEFHGVMTKQSFLGCTLI